MKSFIPIVLLSIFFICCSSSTRLSNFPGKKNKVSDHKTYSWRQFEKIKGAETHPAYYNELNDQRIREAVNVQMQLNHYQLLDSGGALTVSYRCVVTSKVAVADTLNDPQHQQTQIEPYYKNYSSTAKYNFEFPKSPLIIEIFDAKTNALIWHGSALNAINSTMDKRPRDVIQDAVKQIFRGFPAGKE